jgi:hypothetical protein
MTNFRNGILKCVLAGAVVVLAPGLSTAATLVAETDKTIWDGAVSNQNILDFDTALPAPDSYTPPALNTLYQFPAYSVRLNGMTFTNTIATSLGTSNQYLQINGWNTWGTHDYMRGQGATAGQTGTIHIAFPVGGITAFGMNWATGGQYGTLTVSTATDSTTVLTTPSQTFGFYGFKFATPVNYIDLNYTGVSDTAAIDNIIMATAKTGGSGDQAPPPTETPEAASMIMCATGLMWISKTIARRTSFRA